MKSILIASDCFLPRWDGIARFISELIPVLKKEYRLTVIAPDFPGSKETYKGVRVIRIKTYGFQVGDYSPPRIKVKLIGEELAKHDIVFTHTIGPIGAVAAIHGHRLGKPVVSYIHSLEWELFAKSISENKHVSKTVHHITKSFVKRIYSDNKRLLLPSMTVGRLLKEIGIPVPGSVVKLGIDTRKFSPGDKEAAKKKLNLPKGFIIGYAGRIGREKDIPTLIKAFAEIKKTRGDAHLMIVGSGIKIYDTMMEKAGVIRFGPTDKIVNYLRAMDAYVLCSHTETSSLSTMEAMACGVPVFVTGVGETGRYVKERVTGFKFKIGDHQMLAKKILKVIDDTNLLGEIGKRGRSIIENDYSWDKTASNIIKEFRTL